MGSAVSNQVHSFKTPHVMNLNKELRKNSHVGVDEEVGNVKTPSSSTENGLTTKPRDEASTIEIKEHQISIKDENDDLLNKIKNLEVELANVYSQNLDQEDQIQSLNELLNQIQSHSQEEPSSATDYNDTINNTKQIRQLEKEIDLLKSDSQKLKLKYKRKVKLLTSKLTEAQHTAQIQRIEMSNEINQLTELNRKSENTSSETCQINYSSVNNGRNNLVVELSAQVSEQSQIISDLENTLANKQKEIDTLKIQVEQEYLNQDPVINNTSEHCWSNSVNLHKYNYSSHIAVSNKPTRKKTYKLGQHRCLENNDKQVAFVKTVKASSSDSDSDWSNDILTSKIHSAPAAFRAKLIC